MIGRADPGLLELDPGAEIGLGAAHMQRAVVVDVGRADDEVLNGGHQRIPAECLAIVEVDADQPCRPADDTSALVSILHSILQL